MRIVHFGLGNFHRAHQAWYTAHAADAADWGIAALTGRRPDVARTLQSQGGLYTLVTRGVSQDRAEIVTSLVETIDGADIGRLIDRFEDPAVAVVTITVTEAGYRLQADGTPDPGDAELTADLGMVQAAAARRATLRELNPTTMLGRLLTGLEARRRRGCAGLAIVSCDNLPANGRLVRTGVLHATRTIGAELHDWATAQLSFVSTSVDRITPRIGDEERQALADRLDWSDASPVVTEPFHDWVLAGDFPAGRPRWEDAGARFVQDIEPWERRKLWLLNGAHTLLSLCGPLLGYRTVAQAINDPWLRSAVALLWDDAVGQLPSGLAPDEYRAALLERFENPRIEHRLAQIAEDSTQKLRLRIVPVCLADLHDGRVAQGGAFAIAAWILADQERLADPSRALAELEPDLAADEFTAAVHDSIAELRSRSVRAATDAT